MLSPLVNGFMHGYYLARSMDLSWGNRPGLDMRIVESKEKSNCNLNNCKIEKCVATVKESTENFCEDHIWLQKNIFLWKLINVFVICCNIGIPVFMIVNNYKYFFIAVCIFSLDIGSLTLVIMLDIVTNSVKIFKSFISTLLGCFRSSKKKMAGFEQDKEDYVGLP